MRTDSLVDYDVSTHCRSSFMSLALFQRPVARTISLPPDLVYFNDLEFLLKSHSLNLHRLYIILAPSTEARARKTMMDSRM